MASEPTTSRPTSDVGPPPVAPAEIATSLAVAAPPGSGEARPRTNRGPCAGSGDDSDFFWSTGCSSVFGLRGSAVTVSGASATEGSGVMVSAEGEDFTRLGIFSTRSVHRLALGGGGSGFEGTLLGGMTGGFRVPFGERHGPVFRAGAFGYLRGNDAFYASLLELPQVQAGYQYQHGRVVIELGFTSGAVLTGRQRLGETGTRHLGAGLEVGAYSALRLPWARWGASVMRLPSSDELSSRVDVAEATLCAVAPPVAICADARASRNDALTLVDRSPTEVRSLYAGLGFGITQ